MARRKERVTSVLDGDTFKTTRRKHPVRLAGVDAPEKGQPGAQRATERLRKLIGGEAVTIETVARDRYRRAVANVKVQGKSVNRLLRKKS